MTLFQRDGIKGPRIILSYEIEEDVNVNKSSVLCTPVKSLSKRWNVDPVSDENYCNCHTQITKDQESSNFIELERICLSSVQSRNEFKLFFTDLIEKISTRPNVTFGYNNK
jgi:hypothetical protein